MRKARFTDEEMVAILREADREPAGIVAKRHKVSEQTIYNWRKKFGALSTDEMRRLKQLEAENTRLKKLVVDRDLEIEVMKEIAADPAPGIPAINLQTLSIREDDTCARADFQTSRSLR